MNRFETSRLVEFADTDAAGIAHFTAFFRYMEQTEHAFLRSLGESVVVFEHPPEDGVYPGPDAARISWPRVSAHCDYLAPIRFEQQIAIHLVVAHLGNKSVKYQIDFWHDDVHVAKGFLVVVCCRVTHGRPPESIPIPVRFREPLSSFLLES